MDTYTDTNVRTLSDLREISAGFDQYKADYTLALENILFDENARLTYSENGDGLFGARNVGIAPMSLTSHALSQVCQKLNFPPYQYMNQCPPSLRSTNINHWLDQAAKANGRRFGPKPSWFVRSYNATDPQARAVLSTRYSPIDNTLVLDIASSLLGSTPHILIRPYVDPDVLHLKVTVADSQDGNYAIGAYLSNGETGNRTLMCNPFIQRHSCTNSIVFNHELAFTQRHVHVSPAYLRGTLKEKLGQIFKVSADLLDNIVEAEFEEIPDLNKVIANLCKDRGLSQDTHDLILMGTENQSTRMGIVNGLSFAAQHMETIDNAIALEFMAGDYLIGRSRRRSQAEIED